MYCILYTILVQNAWLTGLVIIRMELMGLYAVIMLRKYNLGLLQKHRNTP